MLTTTIGGPAALDADTHVWFRTFCTAMNPMVGMGDLKAQIDPADLEKSLQVVSDALLTVGGSFTSAAQELKYAPPPTFTGGSRFAGRIVTNFAALGPRFTELGEKYAAADPADPQVMADLDTIGEDIRAAVQPLQELQNLTIAPATLNAILQIPSCTALSR